MIWGGYRDDDHRPSQQDEAYDRGYVPSPEDFRPLPAATIDLDQFRAEITAANEYARTHTECGVEDCGYVRCACCDERMTCLGPEPRACGTTCADCPCDCSTCFRVREEMRAELMHQIQKENNDGAA